MAPVGAEHGDVPARDLAVERAAGRAAPDPDQAVELGGGHEPAARGDGRTRDDALVDQRIAQGLSGGERPELGPLVLAGGQQHRVIAAEYQRRHVVVVLEPAGSHGPFPVDPELWSIEPRPGPGGDEHRSVMARTHAEEPILLGRDPPGTGRPAGVGIPGGELGLPGDREQGAAARDEGGCRLPGVARSGKTRWGNGSKRGPPPGPSRGGIANTRTIRSAQRVARRSPRGLNVKVRTRPGWGHALSRRVAFLWSQNRNDDSLPMASQSPSGL